MGHGFGHGHGLGRRAAPTPAMVLAALPGCQLLAFADDAVLDGGAVASVTSKVGPNLVQANAGARPALTAAALNGHAALTFAGAQSMSTAANLTTTTFDVLVVGKMSAVGYYAEFGAAGYLYGTNTFSIYVAARGGAANGRNCGINWGVDANHACMGWRMGGTDLTHRMQKNGTEISNNAFVSGDPGSNATATSFRIGQTMTGNIVMVAVYAPILSAGDYAIAKAEIAKYTGLVIA